MSEQFQNPVENRRNRVNTTNTRTHDRSLSWLGMWASIKSGGVKSVLWTEMSPFHHLYIVCRENSSMNNKIHLNIKLTKICSGTILESILFYFYVGYLQMQSVQVSRIIPFNLIIQNKSLFTWPVFILLIIIKTTSTHQYIYLFDNISFNYMYYWLMGRHFKYFNDAETHYPNSNASAQ